MKSYCHNITWNRYYFSWSHPFYNPAVTFSINHSDRVTAVSESLKNDTINLFDIKKKIDVIPNFVDINKIKTKEKPCERNLLAKKEEKILTHISNFRPLKRIFDVISIYEGEPNSKVKVDDGR